MNYEVVIIGGGINGLATADALLRMGVTSLALVEQYTLGHPRGSSHGHSRITRSSYSSPKYVELMQRVHDEAWPLWERDAGPLLHPTPGCFFGPQVDDYLNSLRSSPEVMKRIEVLTPEEGRRRFPAFLFPDSPRVVVDHTCAVIAAQRTMEFLTARLRSSSARIYEECMVTSIRQTPDALLVKMAEEMPLRCSRLVVTAGPWTSKILASFDASLRVVHQDVGYFELPGSMRPPDFPVWIYAAEQPGESFYGLPQFERAGVKVARHRVAGSSDSPYRPVQESISPEALADLQQFAARQWALPPRLVGYEACLYTNTRSEDFILDTLPDDPRVVIGAGFSGHGFKFAPLTGRILAELALHGVTGVPEFERHREAFRMAAASAWE